MSEAYWGVLGLTPTEDERVIRKAYLSLLPGVHPEEDPDGFRALREAYEFALESARQNDLLDGDDEPQATIEDPELIDAQRWMDQLISIANDPEQRFLEASYETVLQELTACSLQVRYLLAQPTFNWALDNGWLPNQVLARLRDFLDWRSLLLRYSSEQSAQLEGFLDGLDAADVFDLSTLAPFPTHAQSAALSYFSALVSAFGRGNLREIDRLLNEHGVTVIPACRELAILLLRCHVAIEKRVPDVWLSCAERILPALANQRPDDAAWLFAHLHFHRKDYAAAMTAIRPMISVDAAPAVKSFVIELHRRCGQEWVPLWTVLLNPDLRDMPNAADCMVLVMSKYALAGVDSPLSKQVRRFIDARLSPSASAVIADMVPIGDGDGLASLYGWVMQLQGAPSFLQNEFAHRCKQHCGPANFEVSFQIALDLVEAHSSRQKILSYEFDELIEAAKKGTLPAASRFTLLSAISRQPDMSIEALQRLADAAGMDVETANQTLIPRTAVEWAELRLNLAGEHWVDCADFPLTDGDISDCIRFGFLLDCHPGCLWEASWRDLLERVSHQQENTLFRRLSGLLLGLSDGSKGIEDIKEFCRANVNLMDCSGFSPTFARLLCASRMSYILLQNGFEKEQLPDASWVPVLAAVLGACQASFVDNMLFYALLTIDKDLGQTFSDWLAAREAPALHRLKIPGGVRFAEAISMAPGDRAKVNNWGDGFPDFVEGAVDILAVLNRHQPHEQPSQDLVRRVYATYAGESEHQEIAGRLLCGLILGSLKKRLIDTREQAKPPKDTALYPFWFGGLLSRRGFALHLLCYFAAGLAWLYYPATPPFGVFLLFLAAMTTTMLSSLVRRMRDAGLGKVRMTLAVLVSVAMPVIGLVIATVLIFKPSVHSHSDQPDEASGLLSAMSGYGEAGRKP